jgi:hypothetical protein
MPSLFLYANTQLNDKNSLDCFLLAHAFRHQSYAYAASLQGVSTGSYNFQTYPDDTWFQNHAMAHYNLQSFAAPDQTIDLNVLTQYTWDNEDDFYTWMQMHTLIHTRLDEGLEIFD